MKSKMISILIVFLFSGALMYGQTNPVSFKVWGKCGMCETRIEKAAKTVDGVSSAHWNKDTQIMKVTFNKSKTDLQKIETAIAKAGHDTEMQKATDEAYNKLPACCKYQRKSTDDQSPLTHHTNQ